MEGRLALFNMWDHELTLDAIQQVSEHDCHAKGNLLSMSGMSLGGSASYIQEDIECGGELFTICFIFRTVFGSYRGYSRDRTLATLLNKRTDWPLGDDMKNRNRQ